MHEAWRAGLDLMRDAPALPKAADRLAIAQRPMGLTGVTGVQAGAVAIAAVSWLFPKASQPN